MACKNCKGSCGCNEEPITIPDYLKEKKFPEPCSEVFYDACIMHGQPNMSIKINDDTLSICKGERLDSALQKIMVAMLNGEGFEYAAYNFKITSYTESSIAVSWEGIGEYQLVVEKEGDEQKLIDVSTVKEYEICGLEKGVYKLFINEIVKNVDSVTLKIEI